LRLSVLLPLWLPVRLTRLAALLVVLRVGGGNGSQKQKHGCGGDV
jgi:hypothetical protein